MSVALTEVNSAPLLQGLLVMCRDIFVTTEVGKVLLTSSVELKDAAKHFIMQKTGTHNKVVWRFRNPGVTKSRKLGI